MVPKIETRAEAVMSFRVSGKNLDVGEALRARINSRISEAMSKYFDGGYSGHVTVAGRARDFTPNAPFTSIPKSRCAPRRARRTPMQARTRRRCGWKSSCAATIAG